MAMMLSMYGDRTRKLPVTVLLRYWNGTTPSPLNYMYTPALPYPDKDTTASEGEGQLRSQDYDRSSDGGICQELFETLFTTESAMIWPL